MDVFHNEEGRDLNRHVLNIDFVFPAYPASASIELIGLCLKQQKGSSRDYHNLHQSEVAGLNEK